MRVIATKRDPGTGAAGADAVYGNDRLHELLGQADIVALTCPLTPETENLIDAARARRHAARRRISSTWRAAGSSTSRR